MSFNKSRNFAYASVIGGYTSTNTYIIINTNSGARFATASTNSSYNIVWWNYSVSKDPSGDTNREICSVRKYNTNSLYLVRGQEGTSATAKNTVGATYKVMHDFSKAEKDHIENYLYPVGTVLPMTTSNCPTKWAICNGEVFNQTNSEYSQLYSLIGTRFNTSSTGSGKFALPHLSYRVVMHVNTSDTSSSYPKSSIGSFGGEPFHQLTIDEMPTHGDGHVSAANTGFVYFDPPPSGPPDIVVTSVTLDDYGFINPALPHSNLQKYIILQYIVKYK